MSEESRIDQRQHLGGSHHLCFSLVASACQHYSSAWMLLELSTALEVLLRISTLLVLQLQDIKICLMASLSPFYLPHQCCGCCTSIGIDHGRAS